MDVLRLTQGDDYSGERRLIVTVVDEAGAPLDLTGMDLEFVARRTRHSSATLLSKRTGAGGGIALAPQADDTVGVAYITVAPEDTAPGPSGGLYWWQLQATDNDGPVTLATGRLLLSFDLIPEAS